MTDSPQWPTLPGRTPPGGQPPRPRPDAGHATPGAPPQPTAGGRAAPTSSGPGSARCPHCGGVIEPHEQFCESCGGRLEPTAAEPPRASGTETPLGDAPTQHRIAPDLELPRSPTCAQCGGVVDHDGYCTSCGALAPDPRDHYTEAPAPWVAGTCDRGLAHPRNEDALALAASGDRAVLVVCDGVSSSRNSDVAALAAARTARAVLVRSGGDARGSARDAALAAALGNATAEAQQAIVETTSQEGEDAASCTFAAAVVEGSRVYFGNVGDSRVYLLTDDPDGAQILSLDDSVAQFRIALGQSRDQAEHAPEAHAITRWLGKDAEDVSPRTGVVDVGAPAWLCVCTDGLWNYCSEADRLTALVREVLLADGTARSPQGLADALVGWACAQGGRDNVTVALARLGDLPALPAPDGRPLPAADAPPEAVKPGPDDAAHRAAVATQPTADDAGAADTPEEH